ncbi:MAG: sulfatase-like hydrolase/transferase [Planctomycetes bacterium]|nr:sulfatase-like hydrolase/transferase [Planctomycetota bacterium]
MKPGRDRADRRPWGLRVLWLLVTALLVLGMVATAFVWRLRSRGATGRGPGFNVVLVSMDTTRADHLGCYGRRPSPTPNIDGLAGEGTLFRYCEASAPITLASHSSLLTGTDPFVHGARNNGSYFLREENVTIQEILAKNGYTTAAFVGAMVLNREYGLAQGFGLYDDLYSSPAYWRKGVVDSSPREPERPADEVCDHALSWLRAHSDEKFFLFVHFYDAHFPYEPPSRFRAGKLDDYDGEIAFVDEQIGRIRDALCDAGVESRTVVVLTADHGESLGQHAEETHSHTVYESALRVPLVVRAPGAIPRREVASRVRPIDVVPTLLEFLGMPRKVDALGVNLLPLMMGETLDLDLSAYAETIAPFEEFRFSVVRSLTRGDWKYVHVPRPELYDLAIDPDETNNLADRDPDRVRDLREQLQTRMATAANRGAQGGSTRPVDSDAAQGLRALGYVAYMRPSGTESGDDELESFEPRGDDPKDHMAEMSRVSAALTDIGRGRFAAAEVALRGVLQDDPSGRANFAMCHENLGAIFLAQGRNEEAIEHYRAALAANPQSPANETDLGAALSKIGKLDEAIEHFKAALELHPENATARANLGRVLLRKGEVDAGIGSLREAIRIRPTYFDLYPILASVLWSKGDLAEAATVLDNAVALDPDNAEVRQRAAVLFIDRGEYERALALLREGVARAPNDVALTLALARLLATSPRADQRNGPEAVRLAEAVASSVAAGDPTVLDSLAAAYAEDGRFDDAVRAASRAVDILMERGQESVANEVRERIALYESRRAYHESR